MAEFKLDCMHEPCPIPLLKALKVLHTMQIGDILVLTTDHSCTIANVLNWTKKKRHFADYLKVAESIWEIYIEKSVPQIRLEDASHNEKL